MKSEPEHDRSQSLKAAMARGGRVFLRLPVYGDRDEYLALRKAGADFHRQWEPLPPRGVDPFSEEAFVRYLRDSNGERRVRFLLCRLEDGAILGAINFNEIVRGVFESAALGYWIGAKFSRQGLMREGLILAERHAFGALGLHRLEANIRPENTASIALVKSCGFQLEGFSPRYLRIDGEWRDHERWAKLAD